jgi:hypothetical protein
MMEERESRIYWHELPETLPFVRVSEDFVSSRTHYPLTRMVGHNYRVVGHGMLRPDVEPDYHHRRWTVRIFTVRDYDTTPERGGFIPTEAVDPLTLAPNVVGSVTDRCHVGVFPRHPYRSSRFLISRAARVGVQYQQQLVDALTRARYVGGS